MIADLNKTTFEQLYILEGMSLRKIANMYGRSYMYAHHRKTKYGIPNRSWSNRKKISKQAGAKGVGHWEIAWLKTESTVVAGNVLRENSFALHSFP